MKGDSEGVCSIPSVVLFEEQDSVMGGRMPCALEGFPLTVALRLGCSVG